MRESDCTASARASRAELAATSAGALSDLLKASDDCSKRMQARYGVSGPQLWILWELREGSGLSLGEIAERMYLHPSTVSRIADRLAAKGLIARVRRAPDRRVVHAQITPAGEALVRTAPTPMRARLLTALEHMPEHELEALARGLNRLVETSRAVSEASVQTHGAALVHAP